MSRRDLNNLDTLATAGQRPLNTPDALRQMIGAHLAEHNVQGVQPGLPVPVRLMESGIYAYGRFRLTAVGLEAPPDITKDEWLAAGPFLRYADSLSTFWLADWVNAHRGEWGDTYSDAVEATGLDQRYLENIASVANRVEISYRYEKLTFTHHIAVAGLAPEWQRHWLGLAAEKGWSVAKLRAAMNRQPDQISDPVPDILDPKHQATFRRLFKGLQSRDPARVSKEDIRSLRIWLDEIEGALQKEGATENG